MVVFSLVKWRSSMVTAGVGAALLCASTASANITMGSIFLSDFSSDETAAELLDAEFEFIVDDLLGTLTLNVTNNTLGGGDFNMNEVFFNLPDTVSDFMGTSLPTDWSMTTSTMVAGFGSFGVGLLNGVGETDPGLINPGETVSFEFSFSGLATADDFLSTFSSPPPDAFIPSIVAAKFVNGPGDDSAFGAAVPAPGVLALLGLAGLVGTRRRRRA